MLQTITNGYKKERGNYFSAPIPVFWPSHCLSPKISNVSQPTLIVLYATNIMLKVHKYIVCVCIIHLHERSVALLLREFKVAKFDDVERNAFRNAF